MFAARFAIPAISGVVVFGAVTAFAATVTVTSKTLSAGTAALTSCNATAFVAFDSVYSATAPHGYKVGTAPVTSAAGCASMAYQVTISGAGNASLGQASGSLDGTGGASPDFTAQSIDASLVTGVSVVISG